jgi:hypothetical protein
VPVPEVVPHWPEPVVATAPVTSTVAPVLMMMGDVKVPGKAAKLNFGVAVPPPPTNVTSEAVPVLPIDIVIAGEPDVSDDDRDSEPDVATVKKVILPVRPLIVIDTDADVPLVNSPTANAPVAELKRSRPDAAASTVPIVSAPEVDDDSETVPALAAATPPASIAPVVDDRDRVAPELAVAPLQVMVLLQSKHHTAKHKANTKQTQSKHKANTKQTQSKHKANTPDSTGTGNNTYRTSNTATQQHSNHSTDHDARPSRAERTVSVRGEAACACAHVRAHTWSL